MPPRPPVCIEAKGQPKTLPKALRKTKFRLKVPTEFHLQRGIPLRDSCGRFFLGCHDLRQRHFWNLGDGLVV